MEEKNALNPSNRGDKKGTRSRAQLLHVKTKKARREKSKEEREGGIKKGGAKKG